MSTSVSRTRFKSVRVAILCRRKYCRRILASNMGGRIMLEFRLNGAIARNYNINVKSNHSTGNGTRMALFKRHRSLFGEPSEALLSRWVLTEKRLGNHPQQWKWDEWLHNVELQPHKRG